MWLSEGDLIKCGQSTVSGHCTQSWFKTSTDTYNTAGPVCVCQLHAYRSSPPATSLDETNTKRKKVTPPDVSMSAFKLSFSDLLDDYIYVTWMSRQTSELHFTRLITSICISVVHSTLYTPLNTPQFQVTSGTIFTSSRRLLCFLTVLSVLFLVFLFLPSVELIHALSAPYLWRK